MASKHSALLITSIVIATLALVALACATQVVNVPTAVPTVVIDTATPAPQTSNTPAVPVSSPAPLTTPTSNTATATATATSPMTTTEVMTGTIKQNTNIRSGPGVDYALLGNLVTGLSVRLTGRTADKSWWQIEFSAGPDGRGWVVAANLTPGSGDVDALPVASAPPLPTRLPVLATVPTSPGLIPVLRADKAEVAAGECTTLRWDVEGVKAVYLNSGSGDIAVAGHDTLVICPDDTYAYSLRVINKDDSEQIFSYTVKVSGCGGAPIISRFEASATDIKAGQKVTIAWTVSCASEVSIKEGSRPRRTVASRDEEEFQPDKTTSYKLIAFGKDGSRIEKGLTVNIVP